MSNITYRKSIREDIPSINSLFIEMVKTVNDRMERGGVNPYTDFEQGFEPGYLDNFYITGDGVVIFFNQYEIAPYSSGIPTFLVKTNWHFM